jgi:hypothetical protein
MIKALVAGLAAGLALCLAAHTQANAKGGTACGTLVCTANQICCVSDPLPPAGPRYTCLPKGSTCNP